jgi:hypothetical protein
MIEPLIPGSPMWNQALAERVQRYRFASRYVCGKRVLDADATSASNSTGRRE